MSKENDIREAILNKEFEYRGFDDRNSELINTFEYRGYFCEIRKIPYLKHLCGYVHLKKDHPCYGIGFGNIPVECHGGLTFGCIIGDKYVIGFDCGHFGDFNPRTILHEEVMEIIRNAKSEAEVLSVINGEPNKDEAFVTEELKNIVDQLEILNTKGRDLDE